MAKKKSISSLKKKLDTVFSKYVRLRDAIRTTGTKKYAVCISCGEQKDVKYEMDAGHWMGRGAGMTRYDPRNVHAQCKSCNISSGKYGDSRITEAYRRALVTMYGEDGVQEIYHLSKQTKRFTRDELEREIEFFTQGYKALENAGT